ncbi:unnamed protein product, partial [Mesorhabditis spiculigera]
MSNDTWDGVPFPCFYRNTGKDTASILARWLDGPCTIVAALFMFIGTVLAVRFLRKARLNRHLTSALYSLCFVDTLLMVGVLFYRSIEATGRIVLGTNVMYKHQAEIAFLRAIVSASTTASTLLVIYISIQRFVVVIRPLRYANWTQERSSRSGQSKSNPTDSSSSTAYSVQLLLRLSSINVIRDISFRTMFEPFLMTGKCDWHPTNLYFKLMQVPCWDEEHEEMVLNLYTSSRDQQNLGARALINALTQTIVPAILLESQKTAEWAEELKQKVSRAVSLFIAVKFLMLRTLPMFLDIMEVLGVLDHLDEETEYYLVLSILYRMSEFLVVLNSATNPLAYFGWRRWLQKSLRLQMIRKEEKAATKLLETGKIENAVVAEK